MKQSILECLEGQRAFFASGATRSEAFRKNFLKQLGEAIRSHETEIFSALSQDLAKPPIESFISEVAFIYDEIKTGLSHLSKWMKPVRVSSPLVQQPATSRIYSEPLGTVLVIGPWNYPFQLVVAPMVAAIAAGNTVVLKPSELAPATSKILAKVMSTLDPNVVQVFEGGVDVSTALLAEKFDHIFFTGGAVVGRVVLEASVKNLTPVTLELGGKSPCLVDRNVDLDATAKRVVWGKFFNAGQTCVAPDYLLVPEENEKELVDRIRAWTTKFFTEDPQKSPDYARIINRKHWERLMGLVKSGECVMGGNGEEGKLYLAPTVLRGTSENSPVMQEEIFGPILPVLAYRDFDSAIDFIRKRPKPLAFYFFSKSTDRQEEVIGKVSFGGGCMNDTLVHLSNPHLPFGGVGDSGMGAYHGKFGFDTFSHRKAVLTHGFKFDNPLRYPPYKDRLRLLKRFLSF